MHLFAATTFLITALSVPSAAQEPTPAPNPLIQHQEIYPKQTIVVFGMNAVGPHQAELAKTGLIRLLQESSELAQVLPQALAAASIFTGLSRDELETLAGSGFSIGLTAWKLPDQFDFLGVVELGDSAGKIERLLSQRGKPAGTTMGIETFSMPVANGVELSYCFTDTVLLFASSREQIAGSLARRANPALPSLTASAKFRRIVTQLTAADTTQPLAAGYLDLDQLLDGLVSMIPADSREMARKVIENLQLRQASAVGYSALPGGGKITDHLRVSMISEPTGILAAFIPKVGKIDPEFNKFVPADVTSFALTHIRFDELFNQILMAVEAFDNEMAAQMRMMMRGLISQTGVDIERDLFGSFGQRILTLQWPSESTGAPDFALLFELSNEVRFDGALRKLGMLKHSSWQDFQIYSAPDQVKVAGNSMPSLAIGQHFLVLGSSRVRLEMVLKHLTNPKENVRANSLFSAQPAGTVAIGWTNLADSMRSYSGLFARLDQFRDSEGVERFRNTFERLASKLGDSETRVVRDPRGISFISRSSSGNIGGLVVGAISAASAGLSAPAVTSSSQPVPEDPHELELFRTLLTEITVSELAHRESAAGNFVDLQRLVDSGSMDPSALGHSIGNGTFDQGSHLLKVFLPKDEAEKSQQLLVIAWPHNSETGNVYACREDGLPLVNNLLTRADGVADMQIRDIYIGGSFTGKMTPGWRRIEGREMAIALSTSDATAIADRKVFEQILLAEESGDGDPNVLIPILESENPKLVGRAAYAIGKLRMSEAVPDLINILGTHPDVSVRRYVMEALRNLRDPRTIPASAAALSSDDLQVRTLAAQNLGRLRKQEAVESLLGFLASDPSGVGGEARPDRVQAILALCDIGESQCLLSTANSVRAGNAAEAEALTYMFQMLTPKLEPNEEATTLLTVLDHEGVLLRRYAIQRLGELRNKKTVAALEERLALEGPQLRPLIKLALQGILGENRTKPRVGTNYAAIKYRQWRQQAIDYWHGLERGEQNKLVAASAGGLILAISLFFVIRRRRRQMRAENWVSEMIAPSAEDEFAEGEDGYEEEFQQEFVGEEEQVGLQLPPEASIPTGEGWEHAELGTVSGDEDGHQEEDSRR